jgi:hypothetical protein
LFGSLSRQQISAAVAGNRLRRPVPEHDPALAAKQRKTLGKTIQRDLKQFRAIGHPHLSNSYIGMAHSDFTAWWYGEKG